MLSGSRSKEKTPHVHTGEFPECLGNICRRNGTSDLPPARGLTALELRQTSTFISISSRQRFEMDNYLLWVEFAIKNEVAKIRTGVGHRVSSVEGLNSGMYPGMYPGRYLYAPEYSLVFCLYQR